MRIGIFGGCFNPPHKMHKDMALELIDNHVLEKVIYVPTGNKYNKKDLASDIDRYHMLKLITENNDHLEVSDYEFEVDLTYTYQTMDYFKSLFPNDELYFICGADNLVHFDTWREYQYIMSTYKILVVNRNHIDLSYLLKKYKKFKENIIIANIESRDISSTEIREKLSHQNYDLKDLLDDKVIDYIKSHDLY